MSWKIPNWNDDFENNRTRELKRMDWVPIPNRMDGDGYTELVSHENGPAHFAIWIAIVEIASRCDVRGTLLRDGAKPHNFASLARVSRLPEALFREAIPRLVEIGWLVELQAKQVIEINRMQDAAENPQSGAENPQEPASSRARIPERKGTEGNGREGNRRDAAPDNHLDGSEMIERLYSRHPKKRDRGLAATNLADSIRVGAEFSEIDAMHTRWCSEFWGAAHPADIPTLAQWLLDGNWKYEPPKAREPTVGPISRADQKRMALMED